jgi:DNA-binding NarL/FixJ family response regulator
MKANFQSNVALLDIGQLSGTYGNTPNFIYSSWKKMPNYALEYVVERTAELPGTGERTSVALRRPHAAASAPKEPSASAAITVGAISSKAIDKAMDVVLTPRQRDVFDLIVQGMSNKEIARSLQLAEGTVKIHIKALFAKLGVRRRAAVAVAGTRLLSSSERVSC